MPYDARLPLQMYISQLIAFQASEPRVETFELFAFKTGTEHTTNPEAQTHHAIFTECLAGFAGSNNIRDEAGPLVRPILLQNLHQGDVHLCQEGTFGPEAALVRADLDDQVADVIFDAIPLLVW